jgi:hypothetical protein
MTKGPAADDQAAQPKTSEIVAAAEEAIEAGVEKAKEEVREVTERLQERAAP